MLQNRIWTSKHSTVFLLRYCTPTFIIYLFTGYEDDCKFKKNYKYKVKFYYTLRKLNLSAMQTSLMMNKFDLSDFEINVATQITPEVFWFKDERTRMLLVNSFNNYSPWAESTETISWLDRIRLFIVILHGIYSQSYNKHVYISCDLGTVDGCRDEKPSIKSIYMYICVMYN